MQVTNGREIVVTRIANLRRVASGPSNAGRKLKIASKAYLLSLIAGTESDEKEDIDVDESGDLLESERREVDRVGGGVAKPSSVMDELAVEVPVVLLLPPLNQLRR